MAHKGRRTRSAISALLSYSNHGMEFEVRFAASLRASDRLSRWLGNGAGAKRLGEILNGFRICQRRPKNIEEVRKKDSFELF